MARALDLCLGALLACALARAEVSSAVAGTELSVVSCGAAGDCGAGRVCVDLGAERGVADACPADGLCVCTEVAPGRGCQTAADCAAGTICMDILTGGALAPSATCASSERCACGDADIAGNTTAEVEATAIVRGSLAMTVSNASQFVADPKAKRAVASTLAKLVGVQADRVEVTLSSRGRRLSGAPAAGIVDVAYEIALPPGDGSQVASQADAITKRVVSWTPADASSAIAAELSAAGADYAVEVQEIKAPTVTMAKASSGASSDSRAKNAVEPLVAVLLLGLAPQYGRP